MKVLRIRKLKCGVVSFCMEAEEFEINCILIEGLKRFIKETAVEGVSVIPVNDLSRVFVDKAKKWKLTDVEKQYLLNIGFSSILCDQLKIKFPSLDEFDKFPMQRKKRVKK